MAAKIAVTETLTFLIDDNAALDYPANNSGRPALYTITNTGPDDVIIKGAEFRIYPGETRRFFGTLLTLNTFGPHDPQYKTRGSVLIEKEITVDPPARRKRRRNS
jgi:hypothetical protein